MVWTQEIENSRDNHEGRFIIDRKIKFCLSTDSGNIFIFLVTKLLNYIAHRDNTSFLRRIAHWFQSAHVIEYSGVDLSHLVVGRTDQFRRGQNLVTDGHPEAGATRSNIQLAGIASSWPMRSASPSVKYLWRPVGCCVSRLDRAGFAVALSNLDELWWRSCFSRHCTVSSESLTCVAARLPSRRKYPRVMCPFGLCRVLV